MIKRLMDAQQEKVTVKASVLLQQIFEATTREILDLAIEAEGIDVRVMIDDIPISVTCYADGDTRVSIGALVPEIIIKPDYDLEMIRMRVYQHIAVYQKRNAKP